MRVFNIHQSIFIHHIISTFVKECLEYYKCTKVYLCFLVHVKMELENRKYNMIQKNTAYIKVNKYFMCIVIMEFFLFYKSINHCCKSKYLIITLQDCEQNNVKPLQIFDNCQVYKFIIDGLEYATSGLYYYIDATVGDKWIDRLHLPQLI